MIMIWVHFLSHVTKHQMPLVAEDDGNGKGNACCSMPWHGPHLLLQVPPLPRAGRETIGGGGPSIDISQELVHAMAPRWVLGADVPMQWQAIQTILLILCALSWSYSTNDYLSVDIEVQSLSAALQKDGDRCTFFSSTIIIVCHCFSALISWCWSCIDALPLIFIVIQG